MKIAVIIPFFTFTILGFLPSAISQNQAQETHYNLQKTKEDIVLDGELSETIWVNCEVATDFYMNILQDDRPASLESEVRMTYDEKNFYFAITCFDGQEGYVVQSLRRDWDWPMNENFSIYIDSLHSSYSDQIASR